MRLQLIKNRPLLKSTGLILFMVMLGGCASSYQARQVETSGFLNDYSMLKEGKGDQALMVYIDPQINTICKKYSKVILDSVTLWVHDDSSLTDVPVEEQQALTDYFYKSLATALEKDYQLVDQPGPDVMRIRTALTEADGSWVVLDTITTVLPIGLGVSVLKSIALGTASFVADATVEMEIEDSLTGKRLVAAVDRRAGGKGWAKKFDSWGKVETAMDWWAENLQNRLSECRVGNLNP